MGGLLFAPSSGQVVSRDIFFSQAVDAGAQLAPVAIRRISIGPAFHHFRSSGSAALLDGSFVCCCFISIVCCSHQGRVRGMQFPLH